MKTKFSSLAFAVLLLAVFAPQSSSGYIGISVGFAPPAIPIYAQPYCPGPGYLWIPGYWAWNGFDYFWVPGYWAYPPRIGFYWTPGYWGYDGGRYFWNDGYWGPTVGFYGGINYGYGYTGVGYWGAQWVGSTLRYNTAVTRVNTTVIKNTYVNNNFVRATSSRASFNGPGGVTAKATAQEQAATAERIAATSEQRARAEAAKNDPALRFANNRGKPKTDAIKAFNRTHGIKAGGGREATAEAAPATTTGNSEFGHKQGDASTRTLGSQNNAYGKARSTEARESRELRRTTKPARGEEVTRARSRKAPEFRRSSRVGEATIQHRPERRQITSQRAQRPQFTAQRSQRPQFTAHRPQTMPTRQAGPASGGRVKGAVTEQEKKKKKPGNAR